MARKAKTVTPGVSSYSGKPFGFAPDTDGTTNLAHDPRLQLLACCIVHQQHAGFRGYIDLREVPCHDCGAPGFNTGFGYFLHTCGAEILSDGTQVEPCGTTPAEEAV